jgi:hypothetical protein
MKNKITLKVDHHDKKRMEYFLNSVNETLEPIPFNWRDWKLAESISGAFKFKSKDQSLTITVAFTTSYYDANEIAKANSLPLLPQAKWSVNGDLLYFVESLDENKVSEILGLFAGKE